MNISISGPIPEVLSDKVGVFNLINQTYTYNNFSVYQQEEGGHYLFVNDMKVWAVASEINPKRAGLYSRNGGEPQPFPGREQHLTFKLGT